MTQEFRVQTQLWKGKHSYLDLLIIRHNYLPEADIHGKSSTTSTIHYMSNHPIKHKLAAYRFLIYKNTKSPYHINNIMERTP